MFFPRKVYQRTSINALRNHWYCVVPVRVGLHKLIHSRVSYVPLPKPINAKDALYQLAVLEKHKAISPDDSIAKRLRVLIALFKCAEDPTANALERQLRIVEKLDKPP